jgi:hypothetical protein
MRIIGGAGGWRAQGEGERSDARRDTPWLAVLIAGARQANFSLTESASDSGAWVFLNAQNYFWPTATKTAIRPK